MNPAPRQRRKPLPPIAEDDARFPHRQPLDRELRRILENARVTRATPAQAKEALAALKKLLENKRGLQELPSSLSKHSWIGAFTHECKTYAVKVAYHDRDDHGGGTHKYDSFADAYRNGVRKGTTTPELVLVKMKAYGTVEARGNTFLLMEKIKGKPIRILDRIKLAKYVRRAKLDHTPQVFHAIELGRLKDGRPVVMLPHDYA